MGSEGVVLLCAYCGKPSNEHDSAGASRYWCSEACYNRWRMKQPLETVRNQEKNENRRAGEPHA